MSSRNKNILLYKSNCQLSCKFMEIANNFGILKIFNLVCIDGNEKKFRDEKGLKCTPTILLIEQKIKFEGNGCLEWLKKIISSHTNTNNSQQNETIIPNMGGGYTSMKHNYGNNGNNGNNEKFIPRNNVVRRGENNNENQPEISLSNRKNKNIIENTNDEPKVKQINDQLIGYIGDEMGGFSDGYAYLVCDNPMPKSFLAPTSDFQIYTAPENGKIDKQKQTMFINNLKDERDKNKEFIKNSFEKQIKDLSNGKANHKWLDEKN